MLLLREEGVEPVEARAPESFVTLEPFARPCERTRPQADADDAPVLVPRDESRVFQDAQVLDEAREGNRERLRELADRMIALFQARKHGAPRRVRQGAEYGVEPAMARGGAGVR